MPVEAIAKGAGMGFLLSLMVGPVFFGLIETSIKKGFWSALFFAIGILAGDASLIFIAYKGSSLISISDDAHFAFKIIGGCLMMGLGLFKIFKRTHSTPENEKVFTIESEHFMRSIIKGLFLNAINPAVMFFWAGMVVVAKSEFPAKEDSITFFLCILGTLFFTDTLKAFLARYLRALVTPKLVNMVSRGVGVVFVIFGVWMMVRK
ncbi:MAG: LysE family transporter [Flavobacteriales bacterium]|nr:LysE family transporter [Flavobacteriales bacterium]